MSEFQIDIQEAENTPLALEIHRLLVENNIEQFGPANRQPLVIGIRQEGQLVGGLRGCTHWGWLYITHLWVAPDFRRLKLGKLLLEKAEQEAIKRGCPGFYVDTFSPAAVHFYQSAGYELFGTIPDFPSGHQRFFLMKKPVPSVEMRSF
ncbi:MAG: GNAT family N-acetyltransferase [Blastocatellia bacterium]|nr:GNAT family N-acetyltransferase [Blastocatellia bacterium]